MQLGAIEENFPNVQIVAIALTGYPTVAYFILDAGEPEIWLEFLAAF